MKAKKITAACMAAGLALMGTAGVVSYAADNHMRITNRL